MERRELVVCIEKESADSSVSGDNNDCCVRSRQDYGGMTVGEVADALGVSRHVVLRTEKTALRKLRQNARAMAMIRKLLEG